MTYRELSPSAQELVRELDHMEPWEVEAYVRTFKLDTTRRKYAVPAAMALVILAGLMLQVGAGFYPMIPLALAAVLLAFKMSTRLGRWLFKRSVKYQYPRCWKRHSHDQG